MSKRAHSAQSSAVTAGLAVEGDKRLSPRQRSVFRVARVSAGSHEGFARVLNISDDGLKLAIRLRVEPGTTIRIDLSETVRLCGEVIWVEGRNCGVKLTDAIDSAATLARLFADSSRRGDRALRLPCDGDAVATGAFGTRRIHVEDVSLRGMKVRHDGAFTEGVRVKILFGDTKEREAVVRWSRSGRAGVALIEPFSPEELGSIEPRPIADE